LTWIEVVIVGQRTRARIDPHFTNARKQGMARQGLWAPKVFGLIKGGNSAAAIAQIKVAPTVKDLQELRKLLTMARLLQAHPNVDAASNDMIAALSAPRLHRSP
jgi:hypothetical protein